MVSAFIFSFNRSNRSEMHRFNTLLHKKGKIPFWCPGDTFAAKCTSHSDLLMSGGLSNLISNLTRHFQHTTIMQLW